RGRQLIILAGVGGGTIVEILRRLLRAEVSGPLDPVEFMLSPSRNAFELRTFLREHNFELLQEEFVTEKGWHHEHLHLRLHAEDGDFEKPDQVGIHLWQPLTNDKTEYIKTRIDHYRRRTERGSQTNFEIAVNAYQKLLHDA